MEAGQGEKGAAANVIAVDVKDGVGGRGRVQNPSLECKNLSVDAQSVLSDSQPSEKSSRRRAAGIGLCIRVSRGVQISVDRSMSHNFFPSFNEQMASLSRIHLFP